MGRDPNDSRYVEGVPAIHIDFPCYICGKKDKGDGCERCNNIKPKRPAAPFYVSGDYKMYQTPEPSPYVLDPDREKKMKTVYAVGMADVNSEFANEWFLQGIYTEESEAQDACTGAEYFYAPMQLNASCSNWTKDTLAAWYAKYLEQLDVRKVLPMIDHMIN